MGVNRVFCLLFFQRYSFLTPLLISGWKRLLLAEGPRQVLNAITLYSVAKEQDFSFDIHRYQQVYSTVQGVVMSFMLLTVAIWALSAIHLLAAAILYWPLLVCHIRGNLKEYCCHRVDKRISKLLADRRQKRADPNPSKKGRDGDSNSLDSAVKATLPQVEFNDGESVLSLPLYPLARTNTNESQRGLLTRTETTSSVGTHYLSRSNTSGSDLSTMSLNTSTSYRNGPERPGIIRQPTLPQLAEDYINPYISPPPASFRGTPPPRIDTSSPSLRSGPPTARSASAQGFGPPTRSNTNQSVMTPTRERGFGPPPRSQTFGGISDSPRRPGRPY